jgi:hypothetical protein
LNIISKVSTAGSLAARYVLSTGRARRNRELFESIERYCMFIGYPRSGHTLVGALLDAHPETAIGFEQAAMMHVEARFDRDRLYQMLLDSVHEGGEHRWVSGEYTYHVPGQWQGRFERLRVVGDKQAEGATLRIRARPHILRRLFARVHRPGLVHIIRNPFDNITTIATRAARGGELDLDAAATRYFQLCETVQWIMEQVPPDQRIAIRHEDFVARPQSGLKDICTFFGLDAPQGWLNDCASIVRASPNPSRFRVSWSEHRKQAVNERLSAFEYLAGYAYED